MSAKIKKQVSLPNLLKMKDVVGFEGLYKVDEFGNVYSFEKSWITGRNTERILPARKINTIIHNSGYAYVQLRKNGNGKLYSLHRIVAKAFHPLSEFIGAQVNHIDGNKLNNHYLNLQWCTPGENQKHAYRNGLKIPTDKRKPIIQLNTTGEFVRRWDSLKNITDKLGFDRSPIIKVAKGKQITAYGFKWKYEEGKESKISA